MNEATNPTSLNFDVTTATTIIIAIIAIVTPIIYGLFHLVFKNKIDRLKDSLTTLNKEKEKIESENKSINEARENLEASVQVLTRKIDSLQNKEVREEKNYTRGDCISFYNNIADSYDVDNSKEIWVTHRAIAKEINNYARTKKNLTVLDIGGGTGTLLFDLLSLNDSIKWTYADASKEMCKRFDEKCKKLDKSVEIHNENFDTILGWQNKGFDIIVICFLFSSLPQIPNLQRIKNILNENGKIIFADADREYSRRLPYRVIVNDTAHILDTKPLKLADVLSEFSSLGYINTVLPTIKKNEETYSHVVVFEEK